MTVSRECQHDPALFGVHLSVVRHRITRNRKVNGLT